MRNMLPRDPRYFQIAVLSGLLLYGLFVLDFEVTLGRALTILAAALGCQALISRCAGIPFDPRSPLISALSLCLLLRTGSWITAVLVAAITIGSKFVLRSRGKHLFNPTNFGLVVAMACSPWLPGGAWVSPGQWGQGIWLAFLLAGLGSLVVRRAERSDVTWAFLGFHLAIVFGRAAWLGDPWSIPLHGLQSGALLIFAFFMISDPRTTPDSRTGRIVFAGLVAAGGAWVSFGLFRPQGLLWSLAVAALLVPLLDRLFPARRYHWPGRESASTSVPTAATPATRSAAVREPPLRKGPQLAGQIPSLGRSAQPHQDADSRKPDPMSEDQAPLAGDQREAQEETGRRGERQSRRKRIGIEGPHHDHKDQHQGPCEAKEDSAESVTHDQRRVAPKPLPESSPGCL